MESLMWAIYLDKGIAEVTQFINAYIYPTLEEILRDNLTKDFKTIIQEYAQAEFDITPTYDVIEEVGPDHDKNFTV